jgi:small conductance mechanosensitive channel
VSEIQIFVTKLIVANNQTIFVPNGACLMETFNYSLQKIRRADLTIAISYDADIKKSERNNYCHFKNNPKVLQTAAEVSVKLN